MSPEKVFFGLFVVYCFATVFTIAETIPNSSTKKLKGSVIEITEENWHDLLEGEWLVKFFAPWCPACKSLETTWKNVATLIPNTKVAAVDVTEHPGLSGRFLVTSLPTIFHVIDGEFRVYRGSRSEDDLSAFISEKKWEEIDALTWLSAPTSSHMAVLAFFFRASIMIRNLHNAMTDRYGVPAWGSYVLFAVMTLAVGLVLGLLCVCLCDCLWPNRDPESSSEHFHYDEKDDNESDIVDDREEVIVRKRKVKKTKANTD